MSFTTAKRRAIVTALLTGVLALPGTAALLQLGQDSPLPVPDPIALLVVVPALPWVLRRRRAPQAQISLEAPTGRRVDGWARRRLRQTAVVRRPWRPTLPRAPPASVLAHCI